MSVCFEQVQVRQTVGGRGCHWGKCIRFCMSGFQRNIVWGGGEGSLGTKALNTMVNESFRNQISLCCQRGGVEEGHGATVENIQGRPMEEDKSWCAWGWGRHSGEAQSDSVWTSVCLETFLLKNCFGVVHALIKLNAKLRVTETAKAIGDRIFVQRMKLG